MVCLTEKRRLGWDIPILESLIRNSAEAIQQQGRPQGKFEDKELNAAQESGLFLENIPIPYSTASRFNYGPVLHVQTRTSTGNVTPSRDVETLEVDIEEEIEEELGRDVGEDTTTTLCAAAFMHPHPHQQPPWHLPHTSRSHHRRPTSPFPINSYTPSTLQPSPIYWAGPHYSLPAGFTQPASHAMQHQNSTAGLFNHHAAHTHHSSSSIPFTSTPHSSSSSSILSDDSQDLLSSPEAYNNMTMDYVTFGTT
ncbi:hypothetical protein B0H13DRAFT_1878572 [Mycena leptocephala]|nr:hypothetical protein B0H13DRAFT_1878572 [Mycena leptocephala]